MEGKESALFRKVDLLEARPAVRHVRADLPAVNRVPRSGWSSRRDEPSRVAAGAGPRPVPAAPAARSPRASLSRPTRASSSAFGAALGEPGPAAHPGDRPAQDVARRVALRPGPAGGGRAHRRDRGRPPLGAPEARRSAHLALRGHEPPGRPAAAASSSTPAAHFREHRGARRRRRGPGRPRCDGPAGNARLARHRRKLGPDPASEIACTIGGVVANNSSGMACGTTATRTAPSTRWCSCCPAAPSLDSAPPTPTNGCGPTARADAGPGPAARPGARRPAVVRTLERQFSMKNTMGYGLNSLLDHSRPVDARPPHDRQRGHARLRRAGVIRTVPLYTARDDRAAHLRRLTAPPGRCRRPVAPAPAPSSGSTPRRSESGSRPEAADFLRPTSWTPRRAPGGVPGPLAMRRACSPSPPNGSSRR